MSALSWLCSKDSSGEQDDSLFPLSSKGWEVKWLRCSDEALLLWPGSSGESRDEAFIVRIFVTFLLHLKINAILICGKFGV